MGGMFTVIKCARTSPPATTGNPAPINFRWAGLPMNFTAIRAAPGQNEPVAPHKHD
jgi:hypothetical protein